MTVTAVLFDLDGTLVDSNDYHVDAWSQAFRNHGLIVARTAIAAQMGKGGDLLVPSLFPEMERSVQKHLAESCGQIFKQQYLDQVRPFPGATALLQRVHDAGQRIVFASSASKSELEHHIDLLDAGGLFDAVVDSDDVAASKPAPDIFAVALDKLSHPDPAEVLMVGDTPYDIEGAAACGIGTVAVRSGGFPEEALAAAIAIYDDVLELLSNYDRSPLAR